MNIRDAYNAKAIAAVHTKVASNAIPYLGEGLFPRAKKTSLDLKWVKTKGGLPVSLKPSAFDTVSTIRSREGINIQETEMAFFKESMLIKEQDEQDIMRVEDSADPFAKEVLDRVYSDAETLIAGANVVPERMRMQLLSAANGHPGISISADGATYVYDYDPNSEYLANNFLDLTAVGATSQWDDVVNSDPIADVSAALDKVEEATGDRPALMIVSRKTMDYLKKNAKVKNYILAQNSTATVIVTDERVKAVFSSELGVNIIVYTKKYKDETGATKKFFPDGMATLVPNRPLGKTWFGMTPDERTLVQNPAIDTKIVDTGIAVHVAISEDPVQTKTTASEIVLPSFEEMDSTFQIKAYAVAY